MSTISISSGQIYSGYDNGDSIIVENGGAAEGYTIAAGDIEFESGAQGSGGTLLAAGSEAVETVDAGATVSSTTLNPTYYPDYGWYYVDQVVEGGTTVDTSIFEGLQQVFSGTAIGTRLTPTSVNLDGDDPEQVVYAGATAVSTFVSASTGQYAEQVVASGGLAEYTNLNGTSANVQDGMQLVEGGGTSYDTTINHLGAEMVEGGGIISGTTIINGGSLLLSGAQGDGSIEFSGTSSYLEITGTELDNSISGFAISDKIDLPSINYSSSLHFTETPDTLTLDSSSGTTTLNIAKVDPQDYVLSPDGIGGTLVTLCYLRGTRMLTPVGECLVENLQIGDVVVTRYSGLQEIRWIGRQSYSGRFLQTNSSQAPIRIRAGALGEDLPARDLVVSPGHSMLLKTQAGEERLVLASILINGINITQDEVPEEVHYFQLDLLHHDCVIADGTWSETYGDGDQLRGQFHNVGEFYALYPEHRDPDELVLCAPRPMSGPKLDQALRPVVLRAMTGVMPGPLSGCIDLIPNSWKVEGWAHDASYPDLPVLLEVLLHDEPIGTVLACDHRGDLEQAGIGRGRCAFAFSSPVRLPADAMHEIRVRRQSDGAEIAMSEICHAQIDQASSRTLKRSTPSPHLRALR